MNSRNSLPFKLRLETGKTHPTHQLRRPSLQTRLKFPNCWNQSGILTYDTAFAKLFPPVPDKSVVFKPRLLPFRLALRSYHVFHITWSNVKRKSVLRATIWLSITITCFNNVWQEYRQVEYFKNGTSLRASMIAPLIVLVCWFPSAT